LGHEHIRSGSVFAIDVSTHDRGAKMADWIDQVAIVTGSSRGIGRAIARALAGRGAAICINYAARTAEAEAVAGEIAAADGRVIAIQADVADADAVARMVVRTEAELGPVSILVNNAGVSSPATLRVDSRANTILALAYE
jgi:3-oxoacyl-[acyl-carrier protein] reductase